MKTAANREPIWVVLLLCVGVFAFGERAEKQTAETKVNALRETMQGGMLPIVQRSRLIPDTSGLAGEICYSTDCSAEALGWRWAALNGVARQGDCFGEDSAYSRGLSEGCEIYVKAMQLPMDLDCRSRADVGLACRD